MNTFKQNCNVNLCGPFSRFCWLIKNFKYTILAPTIEYSYDFFWSVGHAQIEQGFINYYCPVWIYAP